MADPQNENTVTSSFAFNWGGMTFEVSGEAQLVRDGFALLRVDVLPLLATGESPSGGRVVSTQTEPVTDAAPENPPDGSSTDAGSPTPAAFYAMKNPKAEQEKAVVIAFYAKLHRGVDEFTLQQLEALHNEAHAPIKNVQNAIWNACRKTVGWLRRVSGKKNTYQVTAAGESYVRTQLPKKAK